MAGDWIKMRGNLWDDPRVGALVDATESSEAAIIGGLYWLWATADQHTENGIMPGLSLRQIDRKTGIKGFGEALVAIGWLADHPEGVRILKFEEHNGSSAKKRAVTAKRVAGYRAGNADEPEDDDTGNADVTPTALPTEHADDMGALAREREREREEKKGEKRASAPPRPEDVGEQAWGDWLRLRKSKRAPVTQTVIDGARAEAAKAGMPLQRFLEIWCMRGSQGLQADWLRADERDQRRAGPLGGTGGVAL